MVPNKWATGSLRKKFYSKFGNDWIEKFENWPWSLRSFWYKQHWRLLLCVLVEFYKLEFHKD